MLDFLCEKNPSVVVCGGGMCGDNFWCGGGSVLWRAFFRVATLDCAGDIVIYSLLGATVKFVFDIGVCGGLCAGIKPGDGGGY